MFVDGLRSLGRRGVSEDFDSFLGKLSWLHIQL